MKYSLTTPCDECPFLVASGFTFERLAAFAANEFPCHKACKVDDGQFVPRGDKTPHCAGALIFNEKRGQPHQMMRICERLGLYEHTKLDLNAAVGSTPADYRASAARPRQQSMGINDGKAQLSPSASSPKAAPTAGSVTTPGVSHPSTEP